MDQKDCTIVCCTTRTMPTTPLSVSTSVKLCPPVSSKWNVQSVLLLHGKAIHQQAHHKVVQELGSLSDKLGSTSSPAAPRLPPGFVPEQSSFSFCWCLLLLLRPPRPMPPAQKEGEDGVLPGLLPSSPPKHLQGLGPWPTTKQGERMETQCLHRQGVPSSQCLSAGFTCLLF